ncbi:hypothetical protein M5585_29255 [Serratia ureilytica]
MIYQETVNLLAATEAFRRGVDEVHQRLGGQLHVAIFDHTVSNPQAQIGRAIALFSERAPEVSLQMYVEPINTIERGVIDGQFQVGVIPMHRSAKVYLIIRYSVRGCSYIAARSMNYFPPP